MHGRRVPLTDSTNTHKNTKIKTHTNKTLRFKHDFDAISTQTQSHTEKRRKNTPKQKLRKKKQTQKERERERQTHKQRLFSAPTFECGVKSRRKQIQSKQRYEPAAIVWYFSYSSFNSAGICCSVAIAADRRRKCKTGLCSPTRR